MRKILLLLFMMLGVIALAQPVIQQPSQYFVCKSLEDGLAHFDFSTKNAEILGGLNPALHTVSYFLTEEEAIANINMLSVQYAANAYYQPIYVRVTEIATGEYATAFFVVNALGGEELNDVPDLIIYEEVYDGVAAFEINSQVLFGGTESSTEISFYESEIDAIEGVNAINVSQPYVNTINPQTIWIKGINISTGCAYELQTFQLKVGEGIEPVLTIPDQNFKNKLLQSNVGVNIATSFNGQSIKIDKNNDGLIQISEAEYVAGLRLIDSNISDLSGVEGFWHIRVLDVRNNNLTNLDFASLNKIEHISCDNNQLTSIDVSLFPGLRLLTCNNNQLSSLAGFSDTFQSLQCNGNVLTSLDLSTTSSLQSLSCSNNLLTSLEIVGKPYFSYLGCDNNPLTSLHLEDLDMWTCTISHTLLTEINFSDIPSIESVYITDNPELASINLKNGAMIISPEQCYFANNPNLTYICVDEGEKEFLMEYSEENGLDSDIFMNTLCDETGGNYNTIAGTISFDAANNGCGEGALFNNFVGLGITAGNETGMAYTNLSGAFSFPVETGTFTLTPYFENDWFVANPDSVTVITVLGETSPSEHNFCVTSNGMHPDIEVALVPIVPAQPGFDAVYNVVFKNKGNQVLNGEIQLNFDDAIMDYVSSLETLSSIAPGALTWSYDDLLPFENRKIQVVFNINSPMETPAVNIDDIAVFTINAAQDSDENPLDNQFSLSQVVVGSFDPNDISCLEGSSVSPDMIGKYLHYNINFENTGTAPATFIVVKDKIDESQFDINTLQLLNASHDVAIKIEGGVAEFRFNAINLGPNEKGNIVLKIKSLTTLVENDAVTQRAEIFFDYNHPIITNDAVTVFETILGTDKFTDTTVKIYPNPVNSIVNITSSAILKNVQLYDVQGRLLQTQILDNETASFDLTGRASEIYFLKITTDKGTKVEKLIKE
ncbi:MAG: hypothetical protein DI539_04525 [Flavobacterium psychrophilum]|nr:MAG: hypothetical protein DI539_04525 [Flavobacterium psychrophilum]